MRYLSAEVEKIKDKAAYLHAFYQQMYDEGAYNPTTSIKVIGQIIERYAPFQKGIEVGCGSGYGVWLMRNAKRNFYGCDVANVSSKWKELGIEKYIDVADIRNLPYRDDEFDFVFCTDVMEHILEEDVDKALGELFRIGSDRYFIGIALQEEKSPVKGHIFTHVTIKPNLWWRERIEKAGFDIAWQNDSGHHYAVLAVKYREPYFTKKKKFTK